MIKKVTYIVALILVVLWVVGFFSHNYGTSIHYLLIGALVLLFINVIVDETSSPRKKIDGENIIN